MENKLNTYDRITNQYGIDDYPYYVMPMSEVDVSKCFIDDIFIDRDADDEYYGVRTIFYPTYEDRNNYTPSLVLTFKDAKSYIEFYKQVDGGIETFEVLLIALEKYVVDHKDSYKSERLVDDLRSYILAHALLTDDSSWDKIETSDAFMDGYDDIEECYTNECTVVAIDSVGDNINYFLPSELRNRSYFITGTIYENLFAETAKFKDKYLCDEKYNDVIDKVYTKISRFYERWGY